jgi:hypothetical protein
MDASPSAMNALVCTGSERAQVVEDEDYQLRYEIVAGIDVVEESAVVCVRMPRRSVI